MYALVIAADIGAGPLWVSECRNRSSERKIAGKKRSALDGRGTAGDPDRVNEAQNVALFELFQLEHVKSTEG